MERHTPAPWHLGHRAADTGLVDVIDKPLSEGDGYLTIAKVCMVPDTWSGEARDQAKSDLTLILAAPTLREELRLSISMMELAVEHCDDDTVRRQLRARIQNAKRVVWPAEPQA
jgi:hypothetical protein